jgi:hypothetical protein
VSTLVEVAHSFAWTQGYVTATGWLDWLAAMPLEQRLTLPDGTRLLGAHALAANDDDTSVHPALSDSKLRALVGDCGADLLCVGHTHWPLDRQIDGIRVVNLGSVSNPWATDLRASYVLLDADSASLWLQHRRVSYDRQAVVESLRAVRHRAAQFIIDLYLRRHRPPWEAD